MHTKGPWSLGADLEGVITDYRDEHGNSSPDNYLRNGYVKTVCKLTHAKWAGIEEHVANGKLIAASPLLLEAAQDLAKEPCSTFGAEDIEPGCCPSCRARRAVAAAL